MDIFVSVGSGLSPDQEAFVSALESILKREGLVPHTLERNEWSPLAPLDAVCELMNRCGGAVIVGLERYRFTQGIERFGSDRERATGPIRLPTSWNHIEAALAYVRRLPILVIVDESIKPDGLLEPGHDWYVARLPLDVSAFNTNRFHGLLRGWREKIAARAENEGEHSRPALDPARTSVGAIIGALKPAELWGLIGVVAIVLAAAFTFGAKLGPVIGEAAKSASIAAPR